MKLSDLGTIDIPYMIKVMNHFKDGGKVGYISSDDSHDWGKARPLWDWRNFTYYIIEAPKIHINELRDKWFKHCNGKNICLAITGYDAKQQEIFFSGTWIKIEYLRKNYTYEDGSEIPEIDFGGVE